MIDWDKLRKIYKKKNALKELELKMEQNLMEKITQNENFKLVGEKKASLILGISYSKLKYLRKQGKIGFLRIGRSVKYSIAGLERFVSNSMVEAEK